MKRWCVEYTPEGEVTRLYASKMPEFLGWPPSPIAPRRVYFYCDAIDEMGAFAQFKAAWCHDKEQRDASMHIL